mgnify:FL=1
MLKSKQEMRKSVKKEAAQLTEAYCKDADEMIFRNIRALPEYQRADTVFCYVGTKTEINTMPILKDILENGKILGVPKCVAKGIMEVFRVESLEQLKEGAYGILEPKEECGRILPEQIDLALVPCLCCTKDGKRLGYGGGYYDRYLEKKEFTKVVLCREKLMKEFIPIDHHDVEMDLVISERGVCEK